MWTKTEQQTISATARPLRVAYLVDLSDCPDTLLNSIFAESYSRWGGLRTLIVPAKSDGIDTRYENWLLYFDADIIYSFVTLNDATVLEIHERYSPAHLKKHKDWRRDPNAGRSFRIELPLEGLSSLSVLPVFLSRSWGFDGPPRDVKLLSKYRDRSESPFLIENFGFLSSSFSNGAIDRAHPDLYSAMTLITEAALTDSRQGKDACASYVTCEEQVLDSLAAAGGPLTLAQLSDFFATHLETRNDDSPDGTCIVVGDTPSDRLLFWNIRHRFVQPYFSEITALRIPLIKATDEKFLERLGQVLSLRGFRGQSGHNDSISIVSSSLAQKELDAVAERLRKRKTWSRISVAKFSDHAGVIPNFNDPDRVMHSFGGWLSAPVGQASEEFYGNRAPVPPVHPWHMKEAFPPAGLRSGNWMLDLLIDRETDHCRYENQRHIWRLPRRLRIEQSFELERKGDRSRDLDGNLIRVLRSGIVSVPTNASVTRTSIALPDDLDAIRVGICNHWEWVPFDRDREDSPSGRQRFAAAEYSDKGRYLVGVLQLFESIPDAFSVLMHGFWRDVLHHLGGVPTDSEEEKRQELLKVLRRRTGQKNGPLRFSDEQQQNRLAREALRAGRMIAKEKRYIKYGQLKTRWEKMVENYIQAHPSLNESDADEQDRNVRYLDKSLQHLCQRKILFQGQEWRCKSCYNRNWVGITELVSTLVCSVCGSDEPAPVSGSWQFRINPFVLEAYRDQGTEAVIWALWSLWHRAESSFYFVPSIDLWLSFPTKYARECDAEIDAVAVVDGKIFLVEAKSSGGLDDGEIKQLLLAAERIRPDVLVVASMDQSNVALDRGIEKLRASLPASTQVEILEFKMAEIDCSPYLLS